MASETPRSPTSGADAATRGRGDRYGPCVSFSEQLARSYARRPRLPALPAADHVRRAARRAAARDQGGIDIIQDGAVASPTARIVFAGPDLRRFVGRCLVARRSVIDARALSVVPGFVDAHTHAMFAGDRRDELRRRLARRDLRQIAAAGGGIVSTVAATRRRIGRRARRRSRARGSTRCSPAARRRARSRAATGSMLETELKMLRAIRRAGDAQPVDVVPTFMGAHEIPVEYRDAPRRLRRSRHRRDDPGGRARATGRVVRRLLRARRLHARRSPADILGAGQRAGLKARIHADELGPSGGSQVAAEVGARSADHLIFVAGRRHRGDGARPTSWRRCCRAPRST